MKILSLYSKNIFVLTVIVLFAAGLYAWVFTANFLYLDEAYQLWNRHSDKNYLLFSAHGRLISGILFQKAYSLIDTVSDVKYLRIISLAGWILCSFSLYYFSKKWVKKLQLFPYLPFLLAVFCICSSSVTIYVGWSSCAQVFLAFFFGLMSGHILFLSLTNKKNNISYQVLAVLSGIVSLLIYQTGFGIFIIPFLLVWIAKDVTDKKKIMLRAVAIYLITYLVYYLVFKYYLSQLHVMADPRTDLVFQPLKKIAFFFSTPFSQAWSLNLLVNLHNILSQVFPFILFIIWLTLFIKQSVDKRAGHILARIGGIFLLLFLSYLPSIIAKENFSSYRTMLAMSLCVFILFSTTIFVAFKSERNKKLFIPFISSFLFIIAFLNFNNKFVRPLHREYSAISQSPLIKNVQANATIVFIRPDSKLFQRLYGIKSYKDEFGLPSSYRDWAPEPLTRQLIEEQQSAEIAKSILFYQFENEKTFNEAKRQGEKEAVVIDINKILNE